MRNLKIEIQCGDKTCAYEKGKFCQYFGSRRLGTVACCTLFPSDKGSFTELETSDDGYGWALRCDECLLREEN